MLTDNVNTQIPIDASLYDRLQYLGIISDSTVRSYNVGQSDYAQRTIQPWSVWLDWNLDPWDADIVKRIARHKEGDPKSLDYKKIIHICEEKLRQLKALEEYGTTSNP
jgi:hypothetical protein